jgi:hypothetical protein
VDWGLIVSVIGIGLTLFFGGISFYQAIQRREQRQAFGAYSQGLYNQLSRIGAGAEDLLRRDDLNGAKRIATGINEVSQGARNDVIAISREYARFIPYCEPQWEPKPLPPPWWRRIFSKRPAAPS